MSGRPPPPPKRRNAPQPPPGAGGFDAPSPTRRVQQPPSAINDDQPETTIGPAVKMKGELSFERLLRIDGEFDGKLSSTGDLVIGPSGVLIGDVIGMNELLVDGRIVGNIQVEKIDLRGNAQVHGNITAKTLTMEPGTTVVGMLNVNPYAPEKVNNKGELLVIEEELAKQEEKKPETEAEAEAAPAAEPAAEAAPAAEPAAPAAEPAAPAAEPTPADDDDDV